MCLKKENPNLPCIYIVEDFMEYYSEIESYIKRNVVSKKERVLEENQSILENYWNIGRLLVEAQ